MAERPTIAIIGAGISGLACARHLHDAGLEVRVFDKARGVGGRSSTRRAGDGLAFDHGAQYFTCRDGRFAPRVQDWVEHGTAAPWKGRVRILRRGQIQPVRTETERYVGVPGMSALARSLADGLDVRVGVRVEPVTRRGGLWHLVDSTGETLGEFDRVVSSAPPEQTAALLRHSEAVGDVARAAPMTPCWAVMAAFERPLPLALDGAFVHDSPLSWVARDSSKPGRVGLESWVLHASPEWSREHLERTPEKVAADLTAAFWDAAGLPREPASFLAAHRWRYAQPDEPLAERCILDEEAGLGACGDWCGGPRIEGAYVSGVSMADRLIETAGRRRE